MGNRSLYTGETKIITFAGNKGGIGKTSCSINFAVEAAMHGHQVTLIDLDRQASNSPDGATYGVNTRGRRSRVSYQGMPRA